MELHTLADPMCFRHESFARRCVELRGFATKFRSTVEQTVELSRCALADAGLLRASPTFSTIGKKRLYLPKILGGRRRLQKNDQRTSL